MADDALEMVRLRNNFYRDNYRRAMGLLLISVFLLAVLIVIIAYLVMNRPQPKYFATTMSGKVMRLVPLNYPNMSSKALLSWASHSLTTVYTYNFVDFRSKLQSAQDLFTPEGWDNFLNQLKAQRILQTVQASQLFVNGVVSGAPIIARQGVLDGRYTWEVRMPVLVTYRSPSDQHQDAFWVLMRITRMPTLTTKYGIGISQLIVTRRSS